MSFVVNITDDALDDLRRNADWWAQHHSAQQAILWFETVAEQIYSLDQMPERHPLAVENHRFPIDIREKPVGLGSRPGYRAIYAIAESEVRVFRVLRAAQDELRPEDQNS
jgi:plasmid stabilization system protein ParE